MPRFQHAIRHLGRQWPAETGSSKPFKEPTRRAISLPDTPAAFNRSASRTWRIAILSAGIPSRGKSQGSGR
jgi:hypothetical protein